MASRLSVVLLLVAVAVVTAQRKRPTSKAAEEWNYRDGSERVSMRGVANLTQVLDNWRFDILSQMKGLLQNDHQSLLPDYARIQPLSEALDDLYKEFNALKAHLGDLTEKFSAIEAFIDELKAGGPAPGPGPGPGTGTGTGPGTGTGTGPGTGTGTGPVPRQTGRRVMRKKATSTSTSSST